MAVPAVDYPGRNNYPFPEKEIDILKIPHHHTLADYFWYELFIFCHISISLDSMSLGLDK